MTSEWSDDDDDHSDDGSDDISGWVKACDPNKQHQVNITISSSGTSPIARVDLSWKTGPLGLPGFLLNIDASGSIDGIDVNAFATRLQLGFLLNDAQLYKDYGLPPHDYTPGKEMAAAHILGASLLDHIQTIADRLESE
jgi:hypothetical protein